MSSSFRSRAGYVYISDHQPHGRRNKQEFLGLANGATVNWQAIWHRLTTTKYTAMLEDEVDRLREENRGMLNSLLTRAGVQPISTPPPMPRIGRRMSRNQRQVQIERDWIARQVKPDA